MSIYQIQRFSPLLSGDLLGRAVCVVGWPESGKTLLLRDLARILLIPYRSRDARAESARAEVRAAESDTERQNDGREEAEEEPTLFECENVKKITQEMLETELNSSRCIALSCQSFSLVKPEIRPNIQYVFLCGRLPDREIERIYECYKHLIPFEFKTFLRFHEEICHDYVCMVLDVSAERRVQQRDARVLWYNAHREQFKCE